MEVQALLFGAAAVIFAVAAFLERELVAAGLALVAGAFFIRACC